ncbi:MAG: HAMP domain-containing protein [Clostridia bacterium]|nr:HAMP domain-containing protein [Clostridia bacterium]
MSNLRLSLTLRIALHYGGQLLKTTIPMMAVLMLALWLTHVPQLINDLDSLSQHTPENGQYYTQLQLADLPFAEAYQSPQRFSDNLTGIKERIRLAFSDFSTCHPCRIWLSINTIRGSLIAAWNVDGLMDSSTVLLWTFLFIDLYRFLAFLRHRNRLNRKVLKPITDMAEKAATLSASNLSDRISVEGAKNELKDLALVINDMLDRIEVSYNSQKQFVSDASHELRTPIAVIQGYAGMLERWGKTDKEVLDEGISAISQEAASMKELVERLLFLARHDKKTLMLEMEVFDPLEVMSEIHREAKMLSSEHVFRLEPAENTRINADKDMIKQLMRILLDNAIKYTPPGGKITLGVKRERNGCLLSVSDTGAGISAEELPKIFERFYRCDEARKGQTSGHGLGLSIARIIVSAHKGKLKVRSKVGAGTTFSVLLPLENE